MTGRVTTDGKHLRLGGEPFRIRGVTYGSFRARADGERFPDATRVEDDFRSMVEAGLNTVRTYEVPPVDVLERAADAGIRMMVGLHYHDWRMEPAPDRHARRRVLDAGRRAVDEAIERCAPFSGVLAIAVGNEVPADVVRVHGIAAVEDALSDLVARVHASSPDLLATYVNFPTTEYLTVDDLDLVCFNVFLEDPAALRRYLRHLQVVAGPRLLVVSELGLAAGVHGDAAQAESLRAQLRVVDETGCAGATVFSWTDDWAVAGEPVDGWGFGITTGARDPKPALGVVRSWAEADLAGLRSEWPRVSVVVCAYDEEATIEECLASLAACRYPDLEVIVCDDGSHDRTLEIARRFPFRVLELDHGGLSRARNAGLAAATGAIVAYLDADAACHPEWPFHLVLSLDDERVVATGGPNHGFADAGLVERAVAGAPGSPAEVLLTDDRAEHVPGCNMAYRRTALEEIGGFDAAYTAAGDDVDVCWKLLDRGGEIAFAPAAQVAHHRRHSVRGYLRQQRGYGRAERMLAGAHPQRFNRLGQARWRGVIYGGAAILPSLLRPIVYHGYAGAAPFQPVARRRAEVATTWVGTAVPFTLPVALLGVVLAVVVSPWWLLLAAATLLALAAYGCAVAIATRPSRREPRPLAYRGLVALLHVLQPFARTWGRLRASPLPPAAAPAPEWSGERLDWLRALEADLHRRGCHVRVGAPRDRWDLRAARDPLSASYVTTAVTWRWTPHASVATRPSAFATLMVAGSVVVALAGGGWWWVAPGVVVVGVVASIARITRIVRGALALTAAGARP